MIIVKEQDILKRDPPSGVWTEEAIRAYQEQHGINYGQTVFQRGDKPNRQWSNQRDFGDTTIVNPPVPVEKPVDYQAEIQRLTALLAEKNIPLTKIDEISSPVEKSTHVENSPPIDINLLDKRSKAYRLSVKSGT